MDFLCNWSPWERGGGEAKGAAQFPSVSSSLQTLTFYPGFFFRKSISLFLWFWSETKRHSLPCCCPNMPFRIQEIFHGWDIPVNCTAVYSGVPEIFSRNWDLWLSDSRSRRSGAIFYVPPASTLNTKGLRAIVLAFYSDVVVYGEARRNFHLGFRRIIIHSRATLFLRVDRLR